MNTALSTYSLATDARVRVTSDALNNTTKYLTVNLQGHTGHVLPSANKPFYVVAWDDTTYTNPIDDPNARIGLASSRSMDTITVTWGRFNTPIAAISGTPAIAPIYADNSKFDMPFMLDEIMSGLVVTVGQSGNDYVVDGVADDVQIQAAIDAINAAGGGTVVIRKGTYAISTRILLKSNVCIKGEGMFSTRLYADANWTTGAIFNGTTYTPANPLTNCVVSDMELDGTNMPRGTYQIGRKGIDGHNFRYCMFKDLYIHDTPATGLGIDNLDHVWINHCYIKTCGTASPPSGQGSNGVGLGTGGMTHESVIVTNCITENTANSGYLLEDLESVVDDQKMYIFSNNISINDFTGFSISGCDNATIANNQIYNPTNNGIRCIDFASHYVDNAIIKNNTIIGADSYGILLESNCTNFIVEGNTVKDGTVDGILVRGRKGQIANNIVRENGKHGIFLGAGPGGPVIRDITISGNTVANNSIVTANSDGIRLDGANAAITDINIYGNRCYDDQGTKTQRYGVILSGGTGHSNIRVNGNNLRGNKTGGYLKSSFTATAVSVRDNDGVNPDYLYAQGNVTGATTFNRANGSHITATLTGGITVTLTAGVNEGEVLVLELTQGGTGSNAATWPSNFKKAGGTLTLTTTVGATDVITAQWDGTNWIERSRSLNIS